MNRKQFDHVTLMANDAGVNLCSRDEGVVTVGGLAPWAIKLGTSPGLLSIVTLPPVLPRTSETLTGREELARLLSNPPQSTWTT